MSNLILQPGRALEVIPSDFCDIPYPELMVQGASKVDALHIYWLVDEGVDFIEHGVASGDIVYLTYQNDNSKAAYTVVNVIDSHTVELNGGPLQGNAFYKIYKGGLNNGCVLYNGGADEALIAFFPVGSRNKTSIENAKGFIPIQVIKVQGSTSDNIIALW